MKDIRDLARRLREQTWDRQSVISEAADLLDEIAATAPVDPSEIGRTAYEARFTKLEFRVHRYPPWEKLTDEERLPWRRIEAAVRGMKW